MSIATPASFEITGISINPFKEYRNSLPVVECCRDVELEFDVVNTARAEAGFVEVEIPPAQSYEVHPQNIYIGTLNSDDFSTVRFTLKFKDTEGVVKIPVYIIYTDENNRRRKIEREISVYVEGGSAIRAESRDGILSRFLRWLLGI